MRKLSVVVAAIALIAAGTRLPMWAQSSDEAEVRQAIEHYLLGHATGDGAHFRQVFHPQSKLFWIRDGQLATRTSEEYIAGASGKPADDEAQRKRRIASVDITRNAAVVKVELDYPRTKFTDYMSMLKIDGRWQIVNKTFVAEQKQS